MIIKTITCHDVYNCGASLQAYALQTYITLLGHNVEIINYKPPYLSNHFNFTSISNSRWERNVFLKCVYILLKLPSRVLKLKKKSTFDKFRQKYLKLTTQKYHSNASLKANPPFADVYIAGSDQIWNTLFPNGKDKAFYLDFAPAQSRKISYAASFATNEIVSEHLPFVSQNLQNFDFISVRESSAVDIVKTTGYNKPIEWVCDPVFLLDVNHWSDLANESFEDNYILIYDFDNNKSIESIAKKIASENGWKIFAVNCKPKYADKSFKYAGPKQFMSLIKCAQLVISNSFHGTAFSIIFSKNFYVIPRSEAINTRMHSLLNYLDLSNRLIFSEHISPSSIDFQLVHKKMGSHIEKSKTLLNTILK